VNLYGFVENNGLNHTDYLGLIEIDLDILPPGGSNTRIRESADKWNPEDEDCEYDPNHEEYVVAGHGNPYEIQDGTVTKKNQQGIPYHPTITAKELAARIRKDPKSQNKRIRLISCGTGGDAKAGRDAFAQQLADELQVEVIAPNANLAFCPTGNRWAWQPSKKCCFYKSWPAGTVDPNGRWVTFSPGRWIEIPVEVSFPESPDKPAKPARLPHFPIPPKLN
jgi:hypothetical protein